MAKIDEENFRDQPDCIMDLFRTAENAHLTVEVVKS
jgi:hypothetical protein